jgi:hypothetical protein
MDDNGLAKKKRKEIKLSVFLYKLHKPKLRA